MHHVGYGFGIRPITRLTVVHLELQIGQLSLEIGHCRYIVSKLQLRAPIDIAHLAHIYELLSTLHLETYIKTHIH